MYSFPNVFLSPGIIPGSNLLTRGSTPFSKLHVEASGGGISVSFPPMIFYLFKDKGTIDRRPRREIRVGTVGTYVLSIVLV